MKNYTLLVLMSLLMAACSKLEVTIDNPKDETINFTIDGDEYSMKPKTQEKLDFTKGLHCIAYNNDTTMFEVEGYMINMEFNYTLNPTKSPYIIREHILILDTSYHYGTYHKLKFDTVTFENDITVSGFLEERSDSVMLFYGLSVTEKLPKKDSINSNEKYIRLNKLYRKDEFLTSIREDIEPNQSYIIDSKPKVFTLDTLGIHKHSDSTFRQRVVLLFEAFKEIDIALEYHDSKRLEKGMKKVSKFSPNAFQIYSNSDSYKDKQIAQEFEFKILNKIIEHRKKVVMAYPKDY